ncbi:MAG TPA: hypothetical protein VHC49_07920 [Mycobacteriales bacterium]|nr:hypothetical protein [Mycobacteriales bacterium]
MLLVGIGCVITGFGQRSDVDHAYDITFGEPGDDCDSGDFLYLNTKNGEPLDCTPFKTSLGAGAVPYFSAGDGMRLLATAKKMGSDGLSEDDQRRLQREVDKLAAELPEKDRPYHYSGFWGVWMGGAGIVVVAAAVALYFSPPRRRFEALIAGR